MTTEHRTRFAKLFAGLSELYGANLSPVATEAYWIALKAWSIDELEQAAAQLMQTCQYMPRPVDFAKLRKAATPDAGAAWALVMQHIRSGKYRDGSLIGDPVIDAAAAAVGGYKAIAFHDVDKLHFLARTFGEHFETAQDRHETLAALPNLKPPAGLPALPNLAMRRLS